jgi:hypothetical protein
MTCPRYRKPLLSYSPFSSACQRSTTAPRSYDTGLQFLEWYRDLLEEKLQECLEKAVPAPDLGEQVAKDPAVKAAKQIYDEA